MTVLQAQSGFGLIALCVLAWALGGFRRGISARVLVMGLALQIALGAALLHIAPLRAGFGYLGDAVNALAVDHHIDTEQAIAVGLAFKGNAVLVQLVSSSKLAHGWAGEFCEGLGHDGS